MRLGLWALLGLFCGAFAAHFLLADNGYVLIHFRGYLVRMSVPGLLVALVLAYFAVRLLVGIWRSPRRLGEALAERRLHRAGSRLTRGLIHMVEGEWSKGERLLGRGLRGTDAPLVNYLMAARAAQSQGSRERRDEWLRLAYEEVPEAETAVLLTQAELELEDHKHERALATLKRVQETQPDHPMVLSLLARTYRELNDWAALIELLPRLGKTRLDASALESLAADALEGYLAGEAGKDLTGERLEEIWSRVPAKARRAPRLVRARALTLGKLGRGDAAERELRAALNRDWSEMLVRAYGLVRSEDPARQLQRAEAWLKRHPEDGALLLTAARLCMAAQLWGKARSYLESSLALAPEAESYALYGRLLAQLGEQDGAAIAYRSGLRKLVAAGHADMPALGAPGSGPEPG
jgi:HemY protein